MAERAAVFQQVQVGLESGGSPGTAVAANRLLTSMDIQPAAQIGVDFFRPQGNKFPTVAAAGKDLTTAIALVPMLPKQFDVWIDNTSAGLGTTKLGRLLQGNLQFGGKYQPLWVVDSSQASFVQVVEQTPNARIRLLVEADATGMAF